ncbi:DUF2190 family protein [Nocardioides pakistanensis]
MKNEHFVPASELSLPVPDGTVAGDPVLVGSLPGVAATDRGAGGNIATHATVLMDDRAYDVEVDGAISGVGTPIYFVSATSTLSTTATGNTLWGYSVCEADGSLATKAAGVGPAIVKLAKV